MSETIVGTCTEISERNGWTAFSIDVGTKYPIKLSTKKAEIIAAGRAATGETVWKYNEVESDKINEHTGKPYVNRYLEEVGGEHAPSGDHAPTSAPNVTPATGQPAGLKDKLIIRQSSLKTAAEVIAHVGLEGPDADVGTEVMALAGRFEQWVMRDIDDIPF